MASRFFQRAIKVTSSPADANFAPTNPPMDDALKQHPCLVPYAELSKTEKEYDRKTAVETLKLILSMGYRIEKPQKT